LKLSDLNFLSLGLPVNRRSLGFAAPKEGHNLFYLGVGQRYSGVPLRLN
jgi:hypothetical protein